MQEVHQTDYFLTDPDDLKRNDAGNLVYNGLWIMETTVLVKTRGVHCTYTIKV